QENLIRVRIPSRGLIRLQVHAASTHHERTDSGSAACKMRAKAVRLSLKIRLDRSKLRVTRHPDSRSLSFPGLPAIVGRRSQCRGYSGAMTTTHLSALCYRR